ncbi:MAG: hypothetical protein ACKO4R_00195 [Synechococcales cyanobacterium]
MVKLSLFLYRPKHYFFGLMMGLLWLGGIAPLTLGQSLPTCKPPGESEHVLIVITNTFNKQRQVRGVLPSSFNAMTCTQSKDIVTRIGGFPSLESARNWAKRINESVGLTAFIAPPSVPVRVKPLVNYTPKVLGEGFAVLVDFLNQLEVVRNVLQGVKTDVGVVAYQQRVYLLVAHTTSPEKAATTLKDLSDRGFVVTLVSAPDVVLLRSKITALSL